MVVLVVARVARTRFVTWLAGAALCLMAGCGPKATPPVAEPGAAPATVTPVTITALIWAPDWRAGMQQIATEFSRRNPDITVKLEFMGGNSVEENLKPRVAANNLPDLVSVNPNAYAAELADLGRLTDIGESTAWRRMLPTLKADWMSPNGKRFGISGGIAAPLIYYNKAQFRAAGIGQLPRNFDEFLDVCERLKRSGHTPLYWSGGFPNLIGNGAFSFGFANNIVANTPDWKARIADGTLALDTPAGADIFAKIRNIARRGYTQPNVLESGQEEGISAFVDGKVAMAFQGTWAAGRLLHPPGLEVGVFLPPWNARGAARVPVLGSETGFAVGATANKAAAMRFLEYLTGVGFAIEQKQRQNIAPFAPFSNSGEARQGDPQILAYLAQIESAPVTGSPYYSMLPSNTIELLHRLIQDVLADKLTPRQAARQLETSIRDEARAHHK